MEKEILQITLFAKYHKAGDTAVDQTEKNLSLQSWHSRRERQIINKTNK